MILSTTLHMSYIIVPCISLGNDIERWVETLQQSKSINSVDTLHLVREGSKPVHQCRPRILFLVRGNA